MTTLFERGLLTEQRQGMQLKLYENKVEIAHIVYDHINDGVNNIILITSYKSTGVEIDCMKVLLCELSYIAIPKHVTKIYS